MVFNKNDEVTDTPMKSLNSGNDDATRSSDDVDVEASAAEVRNEKMRVNLLNCMKKFTMILICFIGFALLAYVIVKLIFDASTADYDDSSEENESILLYKDYEPQTELNFSSKLGIYEKAAVCSDKLICSEIGRSLMKEGGSAVDAAIGTLLCNGIATQQSMGIGGGMFMNIYIKEEKKAYTIDARDVAASSADAKLYTGDKQSSLVGGLAISVPGELKGYYEAHQRFGKLPWKKLVEPSIRVCEDGFYMTDHVRLALLDRMEYIKDNVLFKNVYLDNGGNMYPVGTKLKAQKELCETYKLIAENGPNDFYNGTLAKLVLEDLKDLGSIIDSNDLKSYTANVVSSIAMQLGDNILYTPPPVSSGIVVGNILSVLQGYNFTARDIQGSENLALTIHRIIEAMKFGYAKRWELGDTKFNDVGELIKNLTNADYAASLRARINDTYVLGNSSAYDAHFYGKNDHGTSHAVFLAPNGDAVSVTSSINNYFGASQMGKRTGIVFNSGMNDFSFDNQENLFGLPPSPTNYVMPNKRPMSSMSPIILASNDGEVHMVVGSAGGSKIIAAVVEVVARVLWFQNNIKEAIDAPRFYHQLVPNKMVYDEGGLSNEVIHILQKKGQITKPFNEIGAVVCGIVKNSTGIFANADFRKRGDAAGY